MKTMVKIQPNSNNLCRVQSLHMKQLTAHQFFFFSTQKILHLKNSFRLSLSINSNMLNYCKTVPECSNGARRLRLSEK